MTETNTTTTTTQAESVPVTAVPEAPIGTTTDPVADPQPNAQSAEDRVQAEKHAGKLLSGLVREWKHGEERLAKHRLNAAQLAAEYVQHRVSVLGHNRSAAIQAIEGQLATVSGVPVDGNQLVQVHHAIGLLSDGDVTVDYSEVPWTTLTQYAPLAVRDRDREEWSLAKGVEDEARTLFREASTSTPIMPCRDVAKRVAALDAKVKVARAEDLAKLASDPKAGKAAKDAAERAQLIADKAVAKVTGDKDARKGKGKDKPAPEECRAEKGSLTKDAAMQATAKDLAESIQQLLAEHPEPDDVAEELLSLWTASPELSKGTKRAARAALLCLATDRRQQTHADHRNGQLVPA